MHQLSGLEPALALASFTKRMAVYVAVPNLSPGFVITLVVVITTSKMLVVLLHHLPVVFAITALMVGQLRATTVSAWALWFHWH